jgi:hypothetical protein
MKNSALHQGGAPNREELGAQFISSLKQEENEVKKHIGHSETRPKQNRRRY